jgi:hypothetical protein
MPEYDPNYSAPLNANLRVIVEHEPGFAPGYTDLQSVA